MSTIPTDLLIDARRQGWFWMEDDIIDKYGRALGAIGVAVYAYLARRADPNGVSFPSYGTIAHDLNLGRRTVINYIRKLKELGLIVVHRRNGQRRASNVYQLVNVRGREPDPEPAAPAGIPPQPAEAAEPDPVVAIPIAAVPVTIGAADAPVQEMHQSGGSNTGVADTPVQEVHHPGAGAAPPPVQEMHPTGAPVAPEGNTVKETQKKETQMKEKKDLASCATRAASPDDPSLHSPQKNSSFGFLGLKNQQGHDPETPKARVNGNDHAENAVAFEPEVEAEQPDVLAAMLESLAIITGKNLAFLRPQKREQFQIAARKLMDYDFTPEDVRDFGRYWREGHPIGSNKRNAGRPHLSQVLEDLPASRDWNQQRRQEEAEEDDDYPALLVYDGSETSPLEAPISPQPEPAPMPAPVKPQPEIDESQAIWDRLRSQLRLNLVGNPALRPLERAKVLGYQGHRLTLLMPDDASADVWRMRMQIPLERAVIRAFDEPLTVLFLGPTEAAMFAH